MADFCARVLWAGGVDGGAVLFAVATFCARVLQAGGLGVIGGRRSSACCGIGVAALAIKRVVRVVVLSKGGAIIGSACTLGTAGVGDCTLGTWWVSMCTAVCMSTACFMSATSCLSWLISGEPLLTSMSLTALVQSATAFITLLACVMMWFVICLCLNFTVLVRRLILVDLT